MSLELMQLARAYRVPVIDYQRRGEGLLVSSGAGIMAAVMDAAPCLSWCVDVDELREGHRFADWLLWSERVATRIVIVGWFSITDPAPLRAAIRELQRVPLCYTPFTELGGEHVLTIGELLGRLNS